MHRIKRYFKGVNREAHRIRWPIKNYLWNNVLVVFGIILVSCVAIYILDLITVQVLKGFNSGYGSASTSGSDSTSSSTAQSLNTNIFTQAYSYLKIFFTIHF